MNISFTKKELELVRRAIGNYVNIMGEAEQTVGIVNEESEKGLASAIAKIDRASIRAELGLRY